MIASSCSSAAGGRKKHKTGAQFARETKWRTGSQQRVYGRRLVDALRASRGGGSTPPRTTAADIKIAADSALALTAQGQTRWSRALLFGSCRRRKVLLKAGGKIRRRGRHPLPARKFAADASPNTPPPMKGRQVSDRLRVLSRLVPGCRKLSALSLLEEAVDYVAALELQVKTMRALADALSATALSLSAGQAAPDADG